VLRLNLLQSPKTHVLILSEQLKCDTTVLLNARLREGYFIGQKSSKNDDSITLKLPWKHGILFSYTINTSIQMSSKNTPLSQLSIEFDVEGKLEHHQFIDSLYILHNLILYFHFLAVIT